MKLERELESELSQTEAATVQVPEPRHVKYATVMAKNLRRGSHRMSRTVNPGARRSVDKTRMTPEERRELARAQREVMWNLQKGDIVTVVNPGDDPVPYKRQGNPDVNTPLSVKKRLALRKKPLIQEISHEYWCFPGLNPEGSKEMTKESYLRLNRKLHLALIPDTTDEDAQNSAEVDWARDTKRWGGRMTLEAFTSSMFELADIWTENIDEEEYTAFLWLLLETITNTNVVPPSFKPDREIECIVDKDLSEATNRIRQALATSAEGDRTSLSLNMDAITAVLSASRNARGNLSPKLKDKHVQRLRALRQRLQALKQLRTWTAPGRTGDKSNSGGGAVGGFGGVEEVTEIGNGDHASSQGREDALIEDGGSALIEATAGGIAHGHAAGDQSNEVIRKESGAALENCEKQADDLESELPSAQDGVWGDGRGAENGNGGGTDQISSLETNGGVDHMVGLDRGRVRGGDLGANIANGSSMKRQMGIQEYPGYASSKNTAEGAISDVGSGGFANDDESGVRGRGRNRGDDVLAGVLQVEDVADANSHQKIAPPSLDERQGQAAVQKQSRGGHTGGMGFEGVTTESNYHSSRSSNINGDSDSNNKDGGEANHVFVGHGTTEGVSAYGRAHPRGDGDPHLLQGEILGVATRDHVRVFGDDDFDKRVGAEDDRDPDGGRSDLEKHHEGERGFTREGTAGARAASPHGYGAAGGVSANDGKEGNFDKRVGAEDVREPDGGSDDLEGEGGYTREGTAAVQAASPHGYGAAGGVSANDGKERNFDKRVGAEDVREPDGGSGDLEGDGGYTREGTAAVQAASPHGYGAAGGVSAYHGKEGNRASLTSHGVMHRRASSAPGGVPDGNGVLLVNPEESSLQDDVSSPVSSISSGQWTPSPTKNQKAKKAGVERGQRQGNDNGVEAGAANGRSPGRPERTPAGSRAGTMRYGPTGGDQVGPKKDEERNRSERDEAGKASDSSPGNSAISKLGGQRYGQRAGNTRDQKSLLARQSDAINGGVPPQLNEEIAAGVSTGEEANQNADVLQPSFEDMVTIHGENASSASTIFAAAHDKEDATNAMGSWDEGDLTATEHTAERAGSGNPQTPVPSYLSAYGRGGKEAEELRLGVGSGEGGDGSVVNGAEVEVERARDPPSNRWTVLQPSFEDMDTIHGENASSASTIFAAAHDKEDAANAMGSWDEGDLTATEHTAERAGSGNPQTPVPSYLSAYGRGGKEAEELRLGVGSGEGGDGSVVNGAEVEVERARDPPSNRRTADRKDVLSSITVAGKRMSIDSDKNGGPKQGTAGGSNAEAGRKSITAKGREGGEILRRSSSSSVWRQGGNGNPQRSPTVQGNSTAAVADGSPSTVDKGDVGLMHRSEAIGGGVGTAAHEDMPVKPHREVDGVAGEDDLAVARAGRSHRDQRGAAIASNGGHDAEVEAVAHVADREKMTVAAARRISDVTSTQYGEALSEVQSALLRSDGGDEQRKARRAAEEVRCLTVSTIYA
eukprot:g11817.t1